MFVGMIKEQVQKLEGYSADVSMASAESEIRQTFATIRRAEQIGPDVAKWERLRGRAEEKWADAMTKVLELILKAVEPLEPVADELIKMMDIIPPFLDVAGGHMGIMTKALTLDIPGAMQAMPEQAGNMKKLLKSVTDWIADNKDDDIDVGYFWDEFDAMLGEAKSAMPVRAPKAPGAPGAPGTGPFANQIPGAGVMGPAWTAGGP